MRAACSTCARKMARPKSRSAAEIRRNRWIGPGVHRFTHFVHCLGNSLRIMARQILGYSFRVHLAPRLFKPTGQTLRLGVYVVWD